MRKLLSIYFLSVLVVVLFSYFISVNKNADRHTVDLPEKINVFFASEGKSREVNFEDYVVCVVSAEVPASFNEEAIKAQAVAARTYIYNKYNKFKNDPNTAPLEHKDACICTDSKHCCAYYGKEELEKLHGRDWMNEYYKKLQNAVKDTKGEIIVYENEPIIAVFHSSSGGCRTENSQDVWSKSLPYLVSVESPGEDKREGYNSVFNISCDEFKNIINSEFPGAITTDDKNTWIGNITYTQGNSVNTIKIGNTEIKGTKMRTMFGLKSACFEISMLNDTITFNVHGFGHGVGMSQHGANIMANNGKNYKEIIKWYYTGAEIVR